MKAIFRPFVSALMLVLTATAPVWSEQAFGPWIDSVFTSVSSVTNGAVDLTPYVPAINVANGWIPLNTFFGGLVGFIVFFVVYILVKFTLKLIPTVG